MGYVDLDRAPQRETLAYYAGFLPCARSSSIAALGTSRLPRNRRAEAGRTAVATTRGIVDASHGADS